MAVIRIQEHSEETDKFQATVSFNNGPEYSITVKKPFTDQEEDQLEWYFERYLRFPFTDQVKAREAAVSIARYGELLFKQVFEENQKVIFPYKTAVQAGLNASVIEVAGSPKFHALHWEALKDPELLQPLALQATMVRKNLVPSTIEANLHPSPTINLLIITARPHGKQDVGYRTISRPIVETLRQANVPIQIDILRPGTYKALENHLRQTSARHGEGYYHVIHFDVHGSVLSYEHLQKMQETNRYLFNDRYGRQDFQQYDGVKAFLSFESERDDKSDLVEAAELANLLISHQIPITILNACQSGKQIGSSETSLGSRLMQAGVQMVLAMGYSVTVSAAELLMSALYRHLFSGDDLAVAIRHARTELYNNKERHAYFDQHIDLEDWLLPVVYQNQPVILQPREFTAEERAVWFERKAEEKRYTPPDPQYGFVGRDVDILQIEKRLLTTRNILLVRGMGGAGKTTLLRHLAAWWHTTGFVQHVFYFGYDEKAWTLQQIMTSIAQNLYGPKYYTDFQPLSLAAQQAMLSQDLRGKHHLLILDNLESITGAHLAIQHTLPQEDQAALHSFLADLARGHTLVLLGSRSGEDWLAKGTFDDNVYELPGLDPEAASTLADRILERNNATQYRQDEDLRTLIKVLDGFPLALEVVLANLAHQTPTEVLSALQAGDVSLDPKSESQDKTASILRCIDYSHSNLSPEAQQLLLCLAPFTSVIDTGTLDNYTQHLRQQPVLATLPFERWEGVLQESVNWGLLSPDTNISRFLRLQPIFPYFLRNRLYAQSQEEVRSAVETAFLEHYDQIGYMLNRLLNSKEPQERQIGQLITSLEYENLVSALNLALTSQVSILNCYGTLSLYLDTIQDQQHGFELGETVLSRLESYSNEKLATHFAFEIYYVLQDIALWLSRQKQYEQAEAMYQKSLSLWLENRQYDAEETRRRSGIIYGQLGKMAYEQRTWKQAEHYFQQALQIFRDFDDHYNQAKILHLLGSMSLEQRQLQQAEAYYQQALQSYQNASERYQQALTYHQLGRVAEEQRQFEQAEQYYQQALQIYNEYNDRYGQAGTYHQLGVVAQQQRQFEQAEQYYQQALQICIEYNDRYHQSLIYHQLGMVAQQQGQWEQAEQYYQQALQICIEYNDRYSQARTYHQLGIVAQAQRQWEQAKQYYQQSLQIFMEYNDRYEQAKTYHQLGYVAYEQREWEQAEQYYQQALRIKIEYNDHHSQASTYHQLGLLKQEQEHWSQARDYLLHALEIYVEFEDDDSMGIAVGHLADIWKASGDATITAAVASILGTSVEETEKLLREMLDEE